MQDIIQAAMLNMTSEAASQLVGRASAPQAKGFRFPGFAAHYQDYEPSLDHYGFMRTVTLPHFPHFAAWKDLSQRRIAIAGPGLHADGAAGR